jgi:hypothetical protein
VLGRAAGDRGGRRADHRGHRGRCQRHVWQSTHPRRLPGFRGHASRRRRRVVLHGIPQVAAGAPERRHLLGGGAGLAVLPLRDGGLRDADDPREGRLRQARRVQAVLSATRSSRAASGIIRNVSDMLLLSVTDRDCQSLPDSEGIPGRGPGKAVAR